MVKFLLAFTSFLLFNLNGVAIAQSLDTNDESSCEPNEIALQALDNTSQKADLILKNGLSDSKVSFNTIDNQIEENPSNQEPKITVASVATPSLWWAREQFDPFGGKLISEWLTYPRIKRIDLTVNWQLWTLLDYLGRYRFINQFGTVVRDYGYSLRIFNQQQQCLAHYEYNDQTNPPKWEITIEGLGEDSLQVEPVEN